jgi:hypothetical protein
MDNHASLELGPRCKARRDCLKNTPINHEPDSVAVIALHWQNADVFIDHLGFESTAKGWKRERSRREGSHPYVSLSLSNDAVFSVPHLVCDAHQSSIRAELRGLSSRSLELWLSKRDRSGNSIMTRHPAWAEHKEILRGYWDIDYAEV